MAKKIQVDLSHNYLTDFYTKPFIIEPLFRCDYGYNIEINPGIKIGDNSVIGSGSVITKDVPSNTNAAGNPCKALRELK